MSGLISTMEISRMLCLAFSLLPRIAFAQSSGTETIDCYDFAGHIFPNNTQCSGSNICCATADQCNPNKFCNQDGQLVIPACAVYPWYLCANICQYSTGTGYLPRAVQCSDGSFCCDDDAQCCANKQGIVLNGLGAIVSTETGVASTTSTAAATVSSSVASTATQSSLSSSADGAATATAISNQHATPHVSTGLSTGAVIGIAIGAAVIGIAGSAFCIIVLRKRRQRRNAVANAVAKADNSWHGEGHSPHAGQHQFTEQKLVEMDNSNMKAVPVHEMEASRKRF